LGPAPARKANDAPDQRAYGGRCHDVAEWMTSDVQGSRRNAVFSRLAALGNHAPALFDFLLDLSKT
jgi:hypothetical protein